MLPIEFKQRMQALLGEQSERFFKELEEGDAVRSFRVNAQKLDMEEFEKTDPDIDRQRAAYPPECYYTNEKNPGFLPCHHAGAIYMQDPSAMATVHAAKIERGMKILDSCSAPGGKTTQLAALAGEEGLVVANEYDTKRCRILQSNVERMGCGNTVILNLDTRVLAEAYPGLFDVVLCDAPCSGEGMFRKNSLAVEEWSLENVEMCAERQREILTNVAKCVAKGGQLIYSTCTFSQEENEMNVDWFLKTFPDFVLCEVDEGLKAVTSDGIPFEGCLADVKKTRRFYPHISAGEGQYIALFRRVSGDGSVEKEYTKKDKKKKERATQSRPAPEIGEAKRFLDENLSSCPDAELIFYNGSVYLKPRVELPSYGVFAPGVCVGAVTGKTFVPHHQLFSAFGTRFKRQVVLNYGDERVSAYLKGHEIAVSGLDDVCLEKNAAGDGWAAVIVGGCAVGGGKISGGACKNHYPKGLRTKQ